MLISEDTKNLRAPKDIGQGWNVETSHSAKDCVRLACRILEEAGVSLDEVVLVGWEPQEGVHRKKGRGKP